MLLGEMTKHEGGRYHDGHGFLPWYTSPCLEWLLALDLNEKWVYEFGVGDSTIWYQRKGAVVMGVDSNPLWVYRDDVVHIVGVWQAKTKEDYLGFIGVMKPETFDIIIIDGDYRDECTERAFLHLKPGGYLIIDNFHQPSVQEHWPLTDKLIEGMPITIYKEPDHADWKTAVITKP